MPNPDLLSTDEAAAWIGVSRSCLEKWRASGLGPPHLRIGRLVRYARGDLNSWLESRRSAGDPMREARLVPGGDFRAVVFFDRDDGQVEAVGSTTTPELVIPLLRGLARSAALKSARGGAVGLASTLAIDAETQAASQSIRRKRKPAE